MKVRQKKRRRNLVVRNFLHSLVVRNFLHSLQELLHEVHLERRLFVFFFSATDCREGVSIRMITQIFNNDPKGAFVQIAETDPTTGAAVVSSGPFAIVVNDPNKLVN